MIKNLSAQTDSAAGKFHFSGYGELYVSGNIPRSGSHSGLPFIYSFSRNEELNADLILGRANFEDKNFRANLGIMAGTYPQANMAAEPAWARCIYEANAGVKLSKTKNIWLDAGIMPSHIGWESAIGRDNFLLTRSLAAENSPFYETGVKLSYSDQSGKFSTAALVLNGWQRISRQEGVRKPSYGMLFSYKADDRLTLNYTNFLGNNAPDADRIFRVYHDFYAQYAVTKKISALFGYDFGTDYQRNNNETWYSPVVMARWQIAERHAAALRYEYFSDPHGVMLSSSQISGGKISGIAADYDFTINKYALFRAEVKHYQATKPLLFARKYATIPTASFCVKL